MSPLQRARAQRRTLRVVMVGQVLGGAGLAAGLAAVSVTERFALASLMLFDLRSVLRRLASPNFGPPEGTKSRKGGD